MKKSPYEELHRLLWKHHPTGKGILLSDIEQVLFSESPIGSGTDVGFIVKDLETLGLIIRDEGSAICLKPLVEPVDTLKFFAVRNRDGKWLRRKGYGGYGDCWVDNLTQARIYNKSGGARGQINWWYKNYPKYGCPDLVIFTASITEVVNEADKIEKKRLKEEKAAGIQRLNTAQQRLKEAQEAVKTAQKNLEKEASKCSK